MYFEVLTNPLLQVNNVTKIAEIAHRYGAISIVDNTFVTPYLQLPLDQGADIVIHSATKYLAGHSEVNAGLVVVKDDGLGNVSTSRRIVWVACLRRTNAIRCVVVFRRSPCAWTASRRTRVRSPAICCCIRW